MCPADRLSSQQSEGSSGGRAGRAGAGVRSLGEKGTDPAWGQLVGTLWATTRTLHVLRKEWLFLLLLETKSNCLQTHDHLETRDDLSQCEGHTDPPEILQKRGVWLGVREEPGCPTGVLRVP